MARLVKSSDELPNWFPLSTYERDLNEHQWLEELVFRLAAKTTFENTGNRTEAIKSFESIVLSRVDGELSDKSGLLEDVEPASELWGIKEIPPFYMAYLGCMIDETDKGKELTKYIKELRKSKQLGKHYSEAIPDLVRRAGKEGINEWVNWEKEPFAMSDIIPRYPVVIDLDQDDETLKAAFGVWLAGVRSEIGPAPRPVSDKDFSYWKKYGILPVFDLMFWGELNEVKYTDSLIANAVWPDAEVDNSERLRKVTRPKIKEIFESWSFVTRFWRQLELSESLEVIIEKMRNEKE